MGIVVKFPLYQRSKRRPVTIPPPAVPAGGAEIIVLPGLALSDGRLIPIAKKPRGGGKRSKSKSAK